MEVNVTAIHIFKGRRAQEIEKKSTLRCPIALALMDLGIRRPIVNTFTRNISFGIYLRKMPKEVYDFAMAFDLKEKVSPFSFELKGF